MEYRIQSLIATSLAHFANDGNGYVFITLYPFPFFLFPLTSYTFGVSNVSSLLIIGILASLLNLLFSVVASPLVHRMADRT